LDYKFNEGKISSEIAKQAESVVPETITVDYDGGQELYARITSLGEEQLRVNILGESIKSAKKIYETNQEHEKEKAIWRRVFIALTSCMLLASLVFGGILIWMDRISDFQLGVLGGSVLAELFSVLFFMIKYVHTDLYLKTFKTVTKSLLDYLIQDKGKKDDKSEK